MTWGITQFELHRDSGRFLFPAAGSWFGCVDNGNAAANSASAAHAFPYEIKTKCGGTRLNATLCPSNPDLVAFVGDGNLWVTNTATGQETQLTFCHYGAESLADDPYMAGLPCYVMQEEFNRFTGLFWRPRHQGQTYSVLYEEVDESGVELMRFPSQPLAGGAGAGDIEEFRFPRTGSNNAKSIIKMMTFRLDESSDQIVDVRQLELKTPLENCFPWLEYVVRMGWTPDGEQ